VTTSQQPSAAVDVTAGVELCALLRQLRETGELTYDQLAERTHLSRGTVNNYLTKPTHRRGTRELQQLLDALGAAGPDRARALDLHRRTLPNGADPALAGWRARARAAGCTVWSMPEFTAAEASVHPAIGSAGQHPAEVSLPAYVPRAHDDAVRADIVAAAAGELRALIVLRGTSSTGKTRSLWEAVHELCPNWTVIRPRSAAAARRLPEAGLWDRPVVVWLNELQGFLARNGDGLFVDALRDLYAEATMPVVLVGTLWPAKLHDATGGGGDEARSEAHELLSGSWVRWHEVAATLTTPAEETAARELATSDPRLARALRNPDRVGFAQTLAGSHELLEHYHAAPTMARLLLEAAADARRLGHSHAQAASLLEGMTRALWDESRAPTLPADGWFSDALAYATQPLRSADGPRALIPISDRKPTTDPDEEPSGESCSDTIGFALADYLEQHLIHLRRRRSVSDRVWRTLAAYTSHASDLLALSRAATDRGRYDHAEALYRRAAAIGDPRALSGLAEWLKRRPGREADVEAVYREAIAAGDSTALSGLARWLCERPGREAEIEALYRSAITAEEPRAARDLAWWLRRQPGRENDAETMFREAAAAGDREALSLLASWLSGRPGRQADADALYEEMAAAGDVNALNQVLGRREDEVEAACRRMAAAGDRHALLRLAHYLGSRPEREAKADAAYREMRESNDPFAAMTVVEWPADRPDWEADAEAAFREADAPLALARWLTSRPGREADAEAAYREAADGGHPTALNELANWLAQQPAREADVE
jgi:transcriptional regulator with XRE-family HTH domain